MPYFDSNGLAIYYEGAEHPGAPWLVFSNSLGADLSMWEPQLSVFSHHFNVLRYDNRGHGGSSAPEGPYTIAQLAQDVLGLCDHIGADRFHFCGLSMGGAVGQWLGVHEPDRVDRLVLCNTSPKFASRQAWTDRIATVESDGLDAIVDAVISRWFRPAFAQEHPEAVSRFRAVFLATPRAGYVASCAVLRDFDFRNLATKILTPTLVVCGTDDPVTTVQDGQILVDSIEKAQTLQLDSAHLSNVEAADTFNRGVLHFLQGGASE